jgi:hypothetical protein
MKTQTKSWKNEKFVTIKILSVWRLEKDFSLCEHKKKLLQLRWLNGHKYNLTI